VYSALAHGGLLGDSVVTGRGVYGRSVESWMKVGDACVDVAGVMLEVVVCEGWCVWLLYGVVVQGGAVGVG